MRHKTRRLAALAPEEPRGKRSSYGWFLLGFGIALILALAMLGAWQGIRAYEARRGAMVAPTATATPSPHPTMTPTATPSPTLVIWQPPTRAVIPPPAPPTATPLPPSPTPTPSPSPTPYIVFVSDWLGEYYVNAQLIGSPVLLRNDRAIDFDWGYGSPDSTVPADLFAVRWRRRVRFSEGTYRFRVRADDGVRLWVAGNLLLDRWYGGYSDDSVTLHIEAGEHEVLLEYFELQGIAKVRLTWEKQEEKKGTPTPTPIITDWRAEYFNNSRLSGEPRVVRNEKEIAFDWRDKSPDDDIRSDGFSARFTRRLELPAGLYRVRMMGDDGYRLYVDDALVINEWRSGIRREARGEVTLAGGEHTFRIEYFENDGGAALYFALFYELPTPTPTLTATPTATPSPTPSMTATATPSSTPPPTPSHTATATPTATATLTPSPTATSTPTMIALPTVVRRHTATATSSSMPSPTPSQTPPPTATASPTPSSTATPTASATPSSTATMTPSATASPSPTATCTPTPTAEPTRTPTAIPTAKRRVRPVWSATPTPTPLRTALPVRLLTPTTTAGPSATPTAVEGVAIPTPKGRRPTATLEVLAVADTAVDANRATAKLGASWRLRLSPARDWRKQLLLVRFELPELPPGAELASAQLEMHPLYRSNAGYLTLRIGAASHAWDEDIRYLDILQGLPLQRLDPGTRATVYSLREASWDVGEIVRGWYEKQYPNHGFLIEAPGEDNAGNVAYEWASREWGGQGASGPRLRISYYLPAPEPVARQGP